VQLPEASCGPRASRSWRARVELLRAEQRPSSFVKGKSLRYRTLVSGRGMERQAHCGPTTRVALRRSKSRGPKLLEPTRVLEHWCPGTESNRHAPFGARDFKSRASASFATRAGVAFCDMLLDYLYGSFRICLVYRFGASELNYTNINTWQRSKTLYPIPPGRMRHSCHRGSHRCGN